MRFSENGFYVERYLKCANCGLLVYGEGVRTGPGPKGLFCSPWCVEWTERRAKGEDDPVMPIVQPKLPFEAAYPSNFDRHMLLATVEMLWEQVETSGHALHLTADPYPNTPAKKILLHVAYGDHQVSHTTAEIEARSIGAKLRVPATMADKPIPDIVPWYGIEEIESFPHDGSAIVIHAGEDNYRTDPAGTAGERLACGPIVESDLD